VHDIVRRASRDHRAEGVRGPRHQPGPGTSHRDGTGGRALAEVIGARWPRRMAEALEGVVAPECAHRRDVAPVHSGLSIRRDCDDRTRSIGLGYSKPRTAANGRRYYCYELRLFGRLRPDAWNRPTAASNQRTIGSPHLTCYPTSGVVNPIAYRGAAVLFDTLSWCLFATVRSPE
jgi:hypothetical protein